MPERVMDADQQLLTACRRTTVFKVSVFTSFCRDDDPLAVLSKDHSSIVRTLMPEQYLFLAPPL